MAYAPKSVMRYCRARPSDSPSKHINSSRDLSKSHLRRGSPVSTQVKIGEDSWSSIRFASPMPDGLTIISANTWHDFALLEMATTVDLCRSVPLTFTRTHLPRRTSQALAKIRLVIIIKGLMLAGDSFHQVPRAWAGFKGIQSQERRRPAWVMRIPRLKYSPVRDAPFLCHRRCKERDFLAVVPQRLSTNRRDQFSAQRIECQAGPQGPILRSRPSKLKCTEWIVLWNVDVQSRVIISPVEAGHCSEPGM